MAINLTRKYNSSFLDLKWVAEDVKRLEKAGLKVPSSIWKAVKYSAGLARRKLVSTIKAGGGVNGVQPWQPKDPTFQSLNGKSRWFGTIGTSKYIRYWVEGGSQLQVGWVSAIGRWLESKGLQDPATFAYSKNARRYLHTKGVKTVPRYYLRPRRNLIDDFGEWLKRGPLMAWIHRAVDNLIAGKNVYGKEI